ncbi:MAG: HTTM domain-containing protein [Candidatus Wallbacteria bacterium]|nr:HTTM domain-containing protein [Candidatus Wallbacteria bacterium]
MTSTGSTDASGLAPRWHARFARAWDRFFFAPEPPATLAACRVLTGLLAFAYGLLIRPDLERWFGARGVLSLAVAGQLPAAPRLDLLALLPPGGAWLAGFHALFLLAAAAMTTGLATRLSCWAVFLGLASFHSRNPLLLSRGDSLLRMLALYLAFSRAGETFSLDRLLSAQAPAEPLVAPWPRRLIQLQLSLMYVATVMWKLGGDLWVGGTALHYSARLVDLQRFPVPYLFDHLWSVQLFTWGTLVPELALGVGLWVRCLRRPLLLAGALFHLAIEYSMNLFLFQWVVLAAYVAFLDPGPDLPTEVYSTGRRD